MGRSDKDRPLSDIVARPAKKKRAKKRTVVPKPPPKKEKVHWLEVHLKEKIDDEEMPVAFEDCLVIVKRGKMPASGSGEDTYRLQTNERGEVRIDNIPDAKFGTYTFKMPGKQTEPRKKVAVGPPWWAKFKIVDALTGAPLSDVSLDLKQGTEVSQTQKSDDKGIVEFKDIKPGTCQVSCDIKGARLKDTVAWKKTEDLEESTKAKKTGRQPAKKGKARKFRIAKVREHSIQQGETLEAVAKKHGMSWQELAEFNWGTRDSEKADQCLFHSGACPRSANPPKDLDKDGEPDVYRYSGTISIPKKWVGHRFATNKEHTIQVDVPVWEIAVEKGEGLGDDDTVSLEAQDGKYKEEVAAQYAAEEDDNLLFRFPMGDEGLYNVFMTVDGERYCSWKGLELPMEGQGDDAWDNDGNWDDDGWDDVGDDVGGDDEEIPVVV
jgi:hypothetical protein